VFVLDVESGAITDVTPRLTGWLDTMDPSGQYAISPDGREIAVVACRSKPPHDPVVWGLFRVTLPVAGASRVARPREVTPPGFVNATRPTYSPDGRWILFGARRDPYSWADRNRLLLHDRRTGKHVVVAEPWGLAPEEWTFSRDGRTIVCTAATAGRTGLFAVGLRAALARPERKPREVARGGALAGIRPLGRETVVCESTLARPPEIVALGRDGGRRRITAFTSAVMKRIRTARVREIVFDGAGGAPVQMFVLDPAKAGARRRRRPLVHLIHGGPHGAFGDEWHWRWNAQAFAARGYVVALVNFHGSLGWGQSFAESIVGAWGDRPYDDVMQATDVLVERGLADERRMAAAGGSYGGYLASWIASQTDRFACIVNHAGVCDLQTQGGCDVPQGWPGSAGGAPWANPEGMDRFSPMRHASGFRSPMLVIHGERDYRVPYYQALQIYDAYKAQKRDARLVVFPDENHWILKPRNSAHWYGEVFAWLDRWLS
jgi:dipeptidyl aminopeptidase/acylaminoacyl peptidase